MTELNLEQNMLHYTQEEAVMQRMKDKGFVVLDGIENFIDKGFEQTEDPYLRKDHERMAHKSGLRAFAEKYGETLQGPHPISRGYAQHPHNDHYTNPGSVAELLMLYVRKQAPEGQGGVTKLVDGKALYERLSPEMREKLSHLQALSDSNASFPYPFIADYKLGEEQRTRIRFGGYLDGLKFNTLTEKEAQSFLEIYHELTDTIRIPDGKVLLIDELRVMHGRTAVDNPKLRKVYNQSIHYNPTIAQYHDFKPGFALQ